MKRRQLFVSVPLVLTGHALAQDRPKTCPYPGCKAEIKPGAFTCGWIDKTGLERRVCFQHGFDHSMDMRFKSLK